MRKVTLIYMSQDEAINENGLRMILPNDQLESVCNEEDVEENINLIIKHKKSLAEAPFYLYKDTPWVFNPHSYYAVERLICNDMTNEDYWNFLSRNDTNDCIGMLNEKSIFGYQIK